MADQNIVNFNIENDNNNKLPRGRPNKSGIPCLWTDKEYYRQYYQLKKERFICDCGSDVCKLKLSQHIKSKKHQKYIQSLNFQPQDLR